MHRAVTSGIMCSSNFCSYLKTGQIGHVLSCPVLFSDHLPHVKLSSSALFFLDISYRDLKSTIPQYLTVTCLALSLLLFRHDQRISTAMCADIAVFHLIGMTCSFVGNDKTRLNTIMWIVWALAFLGVSMGVFFLSRTWAFTNPNEATNGPPSIFPHSCHSLRQQPKITRKLPHSQSIRVSAGEGEEEWASHNAKFRQCERSLQVMCVSTHLPLTAVKRDYERSLDPAQAPKMNEKEGGKTDGMDVEGGVKKADDGKEKENSGKVEEEEEKKKRRIK
ncbi:hypothetical protein BLNAU_18831 [Blattamonas nauphoetae]|uniref:Uncharacterized protein n=1 Tax=Blattamonas nauphoetae TaxID=2049346 RepID=A0ABQ9X395_9EUKA|nr:hypothetical protein BLNAU_18831 [Blattamonas nauphoetae]